MPVNVAPGGAPKLLRLLRLCLPGHDMQQADAVQAYIQAELSGTPTWVSLPPEARPKAADGSDLWSSLGISDPVVPLVKALYGHPKAGDMWHDP